MISQEKIKSVRYLGSTDKYVYDLHVPYNHKFFSNDILVHNTDSIFLYIDPVLRAIFGDMYDEIPDDEKTQMVLTVVRKCADFVNNKVIKDMLALHNTPSDETYNKGYDFNFKEELVLKRALFAQKKKQYASWIIMKNYNAIDKMELTGIIKSDLPRFSRDMLRDIVERIVRQGYTKMQIHQQIDTYVEKYKEKINSGDITCGIPCSWGFKEYKMVPRAVKGMQIYNAIYGPTFQPGDKGYRFEILQVNMNKVSTEGKKRLKKLITDGVWKDRPFTTIVIPSNKVLDHEMCQIDLSAMLDYCVYNRLELLLGDLGINVRNTYSIGW